MTLSAQDLTITPDARLAYLESYWQQYDDAQKPFSFSKTDVRGKVEELENAFRVKYQEKQHFLRPLLFSPKKKKENTTISEFLSAYFQELLNDPSFTAKFTVKEGLTFLSKASGSFLGILQAHEIKIYSSDHNGRNDELSLFTIQLPILYIGKLLRLVQLPEDRGIALLYPQGNYTSTCIQDCKDRLSFIIEKGLFVLAQEFCDFLFSKGHTFEDNDAFYIVINNLLPQGKQCLGAFLPGRAKAKEAWEASGESLVDVEQKSSDSKKGDFFADENLKIPLHQTLEKEIKRLAQQEKKFLADEKERKSRDNYVFSNALSACRHFFAWSVLASKILSGFKSPYLKPFKKNVEFLCELYDIRVKAEESGNNLRLEEKKSDYSLPIVFPLSEFSYLKYMCVAFCKHKPESTPAMNNLLAQLSNMQASTNKKDFMRCKTEFLDALRPLKREREQHFSNVEVVDDTSLDFLEESAKNVFTIYEKYLEQPPKAKLPEEEQWKQAEAHLVATLGCLTDRINRSTNSENEKYYAINNSYAILTKETLSATKIILAKHLEKWASILLAGDTLDPEVNKGNLEIDLVGKPPMSPQMKAALTALFAVFIGVAIATGLAHAGVAVAVTATAGTVIKCSVALSTAAFFQGHWKLRQYNSNLQQTYESLNKEIRSTLEEKAVLPKIIR